MTSISHGEITNILSDQDKFLEVAKQAFKSVDIDGSGEIDDKELEMIMIKLSAELGAELPSSEDVKEVMDYLDTDKSGTISFDEFKVLILDVLEALLEES